MELNILTLLLALGNLAAGLAIGVYLRKRLVEGNQRNIALQGRQIIENAISEAEQIKKEALLHAKEEALQIKQEADRELKASRQELKEDQRRLNRKFDEVQREFQILEEKQTSLKYREERLGTSEHEVVEQKRQLEGLIDEQRYKLEQIAGIDREEAKAQLMQSIESEARMDCAKRLARIETEMKLEADRKGKNILALAIARYAGDYVADRTVSMVPLPNDEMKGRIIGREGRNIRAIEAATGIDIIIDDTPEAVILSGFNPIRREVARLALEQLISDGRIHPARIEEVVQKVSEDLEVGIRESGEQATFDVGAHGMHVDLINLVGRLKYRTSYGQNILQHSLEVAFLCGVMAAELGLDVKKAKRAGLLHDIGKIGIADTILDKPGPLSPGEWDQVRRHPEMAARILGAKELTDIREWILTRHEQPDGHGYPRGISGEEIPLEARILAVAESYDAMTCERPYRAARTPAEALAEMGRYAGSQFDGRVVDALNRVLASVEATALS